MIPYETLVLWAVFFVCAAGVTASPVAFAGLWVKRWFKIAYFVAIAFLVGIALRGIVAQGSRGSVSRAHSLTRRPHRSSSIVSLDRTRRRECKMRVKPACSFLRRVVDGFDSRSRAPLSTAKIRASSRQRWVGITAALVVLPWATDVRAVNLNDPAAAAAFRMPTRCRATTGR